MHAHTHTHIHTDTCTHKHGAYYLPFSCLLHISDRSVYSPPFQLVYSHPWEQSVFSVWPLLEQSVFSVWPLLEQSVFSVWPLLEQSVYSHISKQSHLWPVGLITHLSAQSVYFSISRHSQFSTSQHGQLTSSSQHDQFTLTLLSTVSLLAHLWQEPVYSQSTLTPLSTLSVLSHFLRTVSLLSHLGE